MARLLLSCGTCIDVECNRYEARAWLEYPDQPGDQRTDWRTFTLEGTRTSERPVMISVRRFEVIAIQDDEQ